MQLLYWGLGFCLRPFFGLRGDKKSIADLLLRFLVWKHLKKTKFVRSKLLVLSKIENEIGKVLCIRNLYT